MYSDNRMEGLKMEGIRKHQKAMIEFLTNEGYEVSYRREIWEEPRPSGDYITSTKHMLIGFTSAELFDLKQVKAWRDGGREGKKPRPLRDAFTYCSASEPFSRRNGNIRATARLMKDLGLTPKFRALMRERKLAAQKLEAERKAARKAKLEAERKAKTEAGQR
jgi:hypothetical protein